MAFIYIYIICWYIHFHGTKNKETTHIIKSNMFSDNMFWHTFRHLYRQQSPHAFWCVYWHKLWHKFRYVFWICWHVSWHIYILKNILACIWHKIITWFPPYTICWHLCSQILCHKVTYIFFWSGVWYLDVLSGIAVERRPMGHATSASLLWGEEKRRGGRREGWV